jgi:hypothetical protein
MPLRSIAVRWSVSKTSLIRHRNVHVPRALMAAKAAAEAAHGNNLHALVDAALEQAIAIVDEAQLDGDRSGAIAALRELRGWLDLLAKRAADMGDAPQVNLRVTREWLTMRSLIDQALEPYPDAKAAVADVILDSEEASGSLPRS